MNKKKQLKLSTPFQQYKVLAFLKFLRISLRISRFLIPSAKRLSLRVVLLRKFQVSVAKWPFNGRRYIVKKTTPKSQPKRQNINIYATGHVYVVNYANPLRVMCLRALQPELRNIKYHNSLFERSDWYSIVVICSHGSADG